jgi:hypothetical protein
MTMTIAAHRGTVVVITANVIMLTVIIQVFKIELPNGNPNVTVWRMLQKAFTLKGVQGVEL